MAAFGPPNDVGVCSNGFTDRFLEEFAGAFLELVSGLGARSQVPVARRDVPNGKCLYRRFVPLPVFHRPLQGAGAETHQLSDRTTPRSPIHIENRFSGDILMIDGAQAATMDPVAGTQLNVVLKLTITAAGVRVFGQPLDRW